MQKYFNSYAGPTGIVIRGAQVLVTKADGSPAAIFSDNGVTPITSLLTDSSGEFAFYAANGTYAITLRKRGLKDEVITGVLLYDPADDGAATLGFRQAGAGAVPRTVQDKLRESVSVKDSGAKGDETDDSKEFADSVVEGREIFIPNGRYDSGQSIYGATAIFSADALFRDSSSGEYFPAVFRRKYADLTDAFSDKIKSAKSGSAPSIVCYGDSNTRYYMGDTSASGPYAKSYGAWIDLICASHPNLYAANVSINGYPGQTAEYGNTNFAANVPAGTTYVVLGFGTNNVKLASANVEMYLAQMGAMIAKALEQNTQPIVLGVPWYSANYGDSGALSQHRIRVWNARLFRLCEDAGVPFIDTYSLTREYSEVYLNEATTRRHYSAAATRVIAHKVVESINRLMSSTDRAHFHVSAFHDLSWIKSHTGTIGRIRYAVGGAAFETLRVAQGSTITISAAGRGCMAFYPRADATVDFATPYESGSIPIVAEIDNGTFYNVKRRALNFAHDAESYDLTITATVGDFYLRALSFQNGVLMPATHATATFVSVDETNRPAVGIFGRTYFFNQLKRPAWWSADAGNYVSSDGLLLVGNTTNRNAVGAVCSVGYKFFNTDTNTVQRWTGSAWV